jgi:hypothetical protein
MERVRFRAPDAARARTAAAALLAARAGEEGDWSLGVLRTLTAKAPGTRCYVVTFAAWETLGERFVRRDVHEQRIWATDATSARRLAGEQVQALSGYHPTWRITRVAPRAATRAAREQARGGSAAGRSDAGRAEAPGPTAIV